MKLTQLLREIERSPGPVTGIELALRLGISPGEVARMLDALRAAGKLRPETPDRPRMDGCASTGSCSLNCPGPDECLLVIKLDVSGLQIRPYEDSSRSSRSAAT